MNNTKSGFVALLGRSNVGKSTLMNHLIGQKIAITANKPQTTRYRIRTVYTDERGQIVFMDTPGIHKAKNKLGDFMVEAALKSLHEADVVLWLVEPSSYIGKGDQEIIKILKQSAKPVILIINKIDTVSKEAVSEAVKAYEAQMQFDRIVTVSALRSTHVPQLLSAIFDLLPYGPMYYDEDTVTNEPMRQIVAEMIREKALRALDEEVPHGIAVMIDTMKQRKDGIWDIEATIFCERDSHKGIIIGKGGSMLKKIGTQARIDAEKMLEDQVSMKLWVKVKKDWRDSDILLRNFGYHEEDEKNKSF